MNTLEKNIINLYGETGKQWLNSLPSLIEKLSKQWQLIEIQPVKNMNYNFVALAKQKGNIPVVLKISCDNILIENEYNALTHFCGNGAIRVIAINSEDNALLLEQAIPGFLLKEHHPLNIEDTIKIYADVARMLSTRKLTNGNYTHASQWCEVIDKIHDSRIAKQFVDKAIQLKSELLNSAQHEYLCHGDLHLENIIQFGTNWLAIDPKGIFGEMAFEAAAFDLLSDDEMKDVSTISSKLIHRITLLSKALEIDYDRLLAWIFLRIIISAQWFIEDNGDPSNMLVLADYVYPLINRNLDTFNFIPLKQEHLPLLHEWFQEPIVKKWYAREIEFDLDDIKDKYLPRLQDNTDIPSYLIQLDDTLIGFIQYYSLRDHLPDGITHFTNDLFKINRPDEIAGIDLFIANSDYRNKKLGVKIINEFCKTIAKKFAIVVVDPTLENQAAIRCYEKCGFKLTDFSESDVNVIMTRIS